jgi:signal transduction histidine kinase/phage shock protein PspC (stress-responsive transcriptional regulator)
MDATSATKPAPDAAPLRRDPSRAMLGGVAAGLARRLGVDPRLIRIGVAIATLAGGWGALLYLLLWATLPPSEDAQGVAPRFRTGRSAVEVGLGAALLLLSALLLAREVGLWSSDALVWPLVLIAGGAALLWRQSLAGTGHEGETPLSEAPPAERRARRAAIVSRTSLGVALVLAAGAAFLYFTGALSAARDVVLAALAVAVVLAVIFAPFIARLAGELSEERGRRVREQERAEMAAHLHDSVLQTLALMQQRAEDPREVATLARHQERELRAWLAGRAPDVVTQTLAGALEAAAGEVEATHRVPVEVVAVGETGLDERGEALVAAAREAMVNAAKHGGPEPVRVFAEAEDGMLAVYVRDRGPGFDPAAVPADRRGVRDSIVGRMARHGGRATIHTTAGAGTEVELVLPREAP